MGHHLSTSKRDSIKARTDEDPMCVRFMSLGSKLTLAEKLNFTCHEISL